MAGLRPYSASNRSTPTVFSHDLGYHCPCAWPSGHGVADAEPPLSPGSVRSLGSVDRDRFMALWPAPKLQ